MATLTISNDGSIHLPDVIRERYGLTPDRPFRIIETNGGILIVPLTEAPMDAELARELEEWQALAQESWEQFPYKTMTMYRAIKVTVDSVTRSIPMAGRSRLEAAAREAGTRRRGHRPNKPARPNRAPSRRVACGSPAGPRHGWPD